MVFEFNTNPFIIKSLIINSYSKVILMNIRLPSINPLELPRLPIQQPLLPHKLLMLLCQSQTCFSLPIHNVPSTNLLTLPELGTCFMNQFYESDHVPSCSFSCRCFIIRIEPKEIMFINHSDRLVYYLCC